MATIHPDYISKGLHVDLVLDGEWHELLPPVKPKPGTYELITALLGKIDPANEPDTNLELKVMRYKVGAGGVLVPDLVDNGTSWTKALMRDLVTTTWDHAWPAKAAVSSTYPGWAIWYRGRGGAAYLEQQLLKFLLQRTS